MDYRGVKKLESVYPYESGIHVVQTDNGPEFQGSFEEYLKKRNIKHNFIYPRCPRINGFVLNRGGEKTLLETPPREENKATLKKIQVIK